MARTFAGGASTDRVVAATSASLDGAVSAFTLLVEVYPLNALASGDCLVTHLTPGADGWNFRVSGTGGNVELRYNRATSALSYITSDTPLAVNTLRRIMVTWDGTTPHVYHDEASAGTLAEATYGTTDAGSGALTSPAGDPLTAGNNSAGTSAFDGRIGRVALFSEVKTTSFGDAWFAEPEGDDATCVLFWCLGSASAEKDFSGTTSGTMNRNPGTVTGTAVSQITAGRGLVVRSVGATARMIDTLANLQTDWLNGVSLSAATGNFRYEFQFYADADFDTTAVITFTGFTADAYSETACAVLMEPATGEGFTYPTKNSGVRWRGYTGGPPGASAYTWECDVPGFCARGIECTYEGGAVAADTTQLRGWRIDNGCVGNSRLERMWMTGGWNTTRAGASVVGISSPGGVVYDCIVDECAVGQDTVSSRCFSAAANGAYTTGFQNCSAGPCAGDIFRLVPNDAGATVVATNCLALRGAGATNACYVFTILAGAVDPDNNLSDDATADDQGGTGHVINALSTDQVRDFANRDFRLKAGSVAIEAGSDLGATAAATDILEFDRDAGGVVWDIGAHEYRGPRSASHSLCGVGA